jgi:hypothetical protein
MKESVANGGTPLDETEDDSDVSPEARVSWRHRIAVTGRNAR